MLRRLAKFSAVTLLCLSFAALWLRSIRAQDQINFAGARGWRGAIDTRFIFSTSGILGIGRHRVVMSDEVREAFGPHLSFPGTSQDSPRCPE